MNQENIRVEEMEPQLVASLRCQGTYDEVMEHMPHLLKHIATQGVKLMGPPVFLCHQTDPEEAMNAENKGKADVEICAPISTQVEETKDIKCYVLPGGQMATAMHEGKHARMPFHQQLYRWVERHNKEITAPIREYYHNDPNRVHENEVLTEVCAPIQ